MRIRQSCQIDRRYRVQKGQRLKCRACRKAEMTVRCDFPEIQGDRCNAPLCAAHAVAVGSNAHFCSHHDVEVGLLRMHPQ